MKRRWIADHLSGGVACAVVVACSACLPDRAIRVSELAIRTEQDDGTSLDIEVHLFDAKDGVFLGCSGENQGLGEVDLAGISYQVEGRFVRADAMADGEADSPWVTDLDVVGRELIFVVTEDDEARCPTLYGGKDDLVGISEIVSGAALRSSKKLSFDRVALLIVEQPWD